MRTNSPMGEADVRDALSKLDLAEFMAGVGHWQFDLQTRVVTWSDEVYRIYGVTRDAFDPSLESAIEGYHPDDRPILLAMIARAEETGEGYDLKLRVLRMSDGAERIVTAKAVVRKDSDGRPAALFGVFQDVTEREEAARRLEASEAYYRLLTENSTDVVARYGLDGTFTYLSPAIESVLGYSVSELIGQTTFSIIDPDDHPRVAAEFADYVRQGPGAAPARIEYRAVHRDGSSRWLEAHPRALFGAAGRVIEFQDVARDITARKHAEAEVASSEARYRLLADNSTDVIIRIAPDATMLYVSPACRSFGYQPEELVGRKTLELVHPDDLEFAISMVRGLFTGAPEDRSMRREYRVLCKDGRYVWLEGNPTILSDSNGAPIEVVTVYRDVSIRRELEDSLAAAKAEAEAASRAKGEFLANMSHELRTPLTSIIGFSGLLEPLVASDKEARRFVDRIVTAGRGLLTTVNDILDFSKLEAGHVEIERRPVDLVAAFQSGSDLLAPQAETKGLKLTFEVETPVPAVVLLDDARVAQVLLNLIGNAVKFTERGEVKVRLSQSGESLRCEVHDDGPGIPEDRAHRLFQRFSQVDASTTRQFGGTGLGLAICKGLVEAMGGRIGVDSVLGSGSCFWFELPCDVAVLEGGMLGDDPSAECSMELAGLRLLVADDNPMNRELINALAVSVEIDVTTVDCGEAAVAAAAAAPFDIILMDVRMPGQDGPTSAALIRAGRGPNAETPILAFTADTELHDSWAAVFDDRVAKPIVTAQLFEALARWSPCGEQIISKVAVVRP